MEVCLTDIHSYARPQSPDCVPLSDFTSSTPAPQKGKAVTTTPTSKKGKTELTLAELQENIVRILVEKIASEPRMWEKRLTIWGSSSHKIQKVLKTWKKIQFLFKEIQNMKKHVSTMMKVNTDHEKRISELEDKLNETEWYQRQWNQRLYGLPEQEGEDIKRWVTDICWDLLPRIDINHRVERRIEGKTHPVIIRFIFRSTKELVWKRGQGLDYLTSRKFRFGEDLTTKDKETHNRLWPHIEGALKEGKKALFIGFKVMIDGKELWPERWMPDLANIECWNVANR